MIQSWQGAEQVNGLNEPNQDPLLAPVLRSQGPPSASSGLSNLAEDAKPGDRPQAILKPARVLLVVGALGIVTLGLLTGSAGIIAGLLGPRSDRLATITLCISFLALTVGLGLVLAWHGWRSLQGHESAPFQPRHIWQWGLLYLLALPAGQIILSRNLLPVLAFPPFHLIAGVLPPLMVVGLVGRSLGGMVRWRGVVLQVSSGVFLATSLAFAIEAVAILGLLLLAVAAVAAQPGGLELLQTLAAHLEDPVWLQDPNRLVKLVREPIVLAAIFLVAAGVIPLVEEAIKTVGVGLLAWQHPGPIRAFVWGVAGGAGFAAAEGLLNTAGALDAWGVVVLLRVGATLLHCFTGGLMGLAWYHLVSLRHWGRAAGLYAASAGLHAVWNGLAAGMSVVSLSSQSNGQALVGPGTVTILALLIGLGLLVGLGLAGLTLSLRQRQSAPRPGS